MENEIQSQNVFASKDSFEHIQRVAAVFSKSDMVPKRYAGNIGNCIIALEMANRMNANILMVMQNLDIILGKPAWSSKFLIATLNACGKFSPIRYESDDQEGGRTRAVSTDKATGETLQGAWVSMNMANAEGWVNKAASKWKTMPELMIRYRAASFFVNQFAPEVSMGLQTVEEVIDITPIQTVNATNLLAERVQLMINDCTTIEDLELLQSSNPDIDIKLFDAKKELLKGGK